MSDSQTLSIWTVYERPQDYPDRCVARRWLATTPVPSPTDDVLLADDLAGLRQQMPAGLVRMPRHQDDDPVILETWM